MSEFQRDPIKIELLKNALTAIADEMAVTVVRTARSFVIKESLDFSCGLMDAKGMLIAQGLCLPMHMGSFPPTMLSILSEYGHDLREGDIFATNDPYLGGGTHLPDIYIFKPIFFNKQLIGFAAAIGHQTDIGGRVPGGNACDNTEIYQEGIRIPPIRIFERNKPNDLFFKMMRANVRVPEKVLGDIMATVAACSRGEEGLKVLAQTYGVAELQEHMNDLIDYAEELTRAELISLPDGKWEFEDFLDDDGFQKEPIRIKVKLIKKNDELTADFKGTSPQVKGSINLPRSLARMLPKKVFACGVQGDYGVTIAGYYPNGTPFVSLEFLFSGWGGRPDKDGIDGISTLAVNYANTPVEVLEVEQPLRIESYGFVPDTGGPGKYRGSLGIEREYRLVGADEAVLQVRGDRHKFQPFGLYGGKPGAFASSTINPNSEGEQIPPSKFMTTMKKGDLFRAQLAGGGGWGNPYERDPKRVIEDVINGKISSNAASKEYGVQIDENTMSVDEQATRNLREAMANSNLN